MFVAGCLVLFVISSSLPVELICCLLFVVMLFVLGCVLIVVVCDVGVRCVLLVVCCVLLVV